MNNALFWARFIREVFLPQAEVLRETIFDRLLPTFDTISGEAEDAAREAYQRLGRMSGPEGDLGDIAEAAQDAGVARYLILSDTKQGLLNLFAVAIHHLLDQQLLVILRKELLPPNGEDDHQLLTRSEFVSRLQATGIDPTQYASWDILDELREVANVVKHGEGRSAQALQERRPELFVVPLLRESEFQRPLRDFRHVYQPLSGEDLYVTPEELSQYFAAAMAFWEQFVADLEEHHRRFIENRA